MIEFLAKQFLGYRKLVAHKFAIRRYNRLRAFQRKLYDAWIESVCQRQPQVFAGANLATGGIRNHLLAIKKHSSLQVELLPDERAFRELKNFTKELKHELWNFIPKNCLSIHTHVLPWMIRWGQNAQKNGLRWIHTYHLNYFPEHGKAGLEPWQIEINDALLQEAPKADIKLSVAKWQRDQLKQQFGIDTYYLPNGVDVEICDMGKGRRFTNKTGLKNYILYVGRDDPVKDPATFAILAKRIPEMEFVMIGHGLSAEVLRNVYDQETPNNLHILGEENHQGVQDALEACAALVVTSRREGLPTLVLEAMTHGKPIVVPNEAGCMEAVDHGRYGFIYELDDIADLEEKTRAALTDHERCSRARARVLEEYDWRRVAKILDIVYSEPDLEKARQILQDIQDT